MPVLHDDEWHVQHHGVLLKDLSRDALETFGSRVFDDQLHERPTKAPALEVGSQQDRVFSGFVDRIGVNSHHANDLPGDLIEQRPQAAPHNIMVAGVGPGAVATPINLSTMNDPALLKKLDDAIPIGRMAQPEEIARVVAFLAGDGGSYITATTIFADGGIMQSSPGL